MSWRAETPCLACHNPRLMTRARKTAAAATRMVPRVLAYVRARGVDASALALRVGLSADAERMDEVAITPSDFERLLAAAATAVRDPLLAVHLPEGLRFTGYNLGELAARSSPTLAEAFARAARYAPLFYAHLAFTCEDVDGELVLTQRLRSADAGGRYGNEYGVATTLFHARALAGREISAVRVFFRHADVPRAERAALEAHFGTRRLLFGATANGLAFSRADAGRPCRAHDARLLATAEELADRALLDRPSEADFLASVEAKIRIGLSTDAFEMLAVAKTMRLAKRTLQRRLEERGTTFTDLLERVRREVAFEHVQDGRMPLEEIAQHAGFADAASFGRAFKRWTGVSPGQHRKARRSP